MPYFSFPIVVDIFSHGRMPILAVSRLHLIDPSSIEHNIACLLIIDLKFKQYNTMLN